MPDDIIMFNGKKYVAMDYIHKLLQLIKENPKMDIGLSEAFLDNWFDVGWRKCAQHLDNLVGRL